MRAEGQRKPFDRLHAELALNTTVTNLLTQPAVALYSSELKEALCNSAGEKLDWEVSLCVAAKRK